MKKAIVTLTVGQRFKEYWDRYCRQTWMSYASLHDYDLIIFDYLLDSSERGHSRSPSWQRCLILKNELVSKYDQVVWIDADVIINPDAPCIASQVPIDRIGGVEAYSFINKSIHKQALNTLHSAWKHNKVNFIEELTGNEFYCNYGFETEYNDVIQCGVLVLSPKYHRELLEYVYNSYEDKGEAFWNYEMRPLSYEIVRNNMQHFVDFRFNYEIQTFLAVSYPYLLYEGKFNNNKLLLKIEDFFRYYKRHNSYNIITLAINTAFRNSFFLHFAGAAYLAKYYDSSLFKMPYQLNNLTYINI